MIYTVVLFRKIKEPLSEKHLKLSHYRFLHALSNTQYHAHTHPSQVNHLTPNDAYRGRTAPLTSKVAFYIYLFNKYRY